MQDALTPDEGARVELVLVTASGDGASYDAVVAMRAASPARFRLRLVRGADPVVESVYEEASDAAIALASSVARTVSKGASWPRRVTRWKLLPDAGAAR